MARGISPSVIIVLTIINFIGILINFICLSYNTSSDEQRNLKQISKFNLAGNNNKRFNTKQNLYNYNTNFSNIDFEKENYAKLNYSIKEKLKLRKLSNSSYSNYFKYMIIFNCIISYFWIILFFSFFVKNYENEVCLCYCCSGNCNHCCYFFFFRSDNPNFIYNCGECRGFIVCFIIFFILFNVIFIIFYQTKLLGKKLSRYISLISIIIFNFFICLKSFLSLNNELYIKIILIISIILLISNILGILLPNLKWFEVLTYNYEISCKENTDTKTKTNDNIEKNINSNNANNMPVVIIQNDLIQSIKRNSLTQTNIGEKSLTSEDNITASMSKVESSSERQIYSNTSYI